MFKEFIDFCTVSRNLTPATLEHYAYVLSLWSAFLCQRAVTVEDATSFDVLDFLAECHRNGCQASSCNQYLVVLRCFYRWLVRFHFEVCQLSPAEEVQKMKCEKVLPVCLSKQLLERIVASLPAASFKQARTRAVFLACYHCGLRRGEVASLDDASVDFSSRVLRVYGKGRKVRLVPMSDALVRALHVYLILRSESISYPGALFVQSSGQRLEPAQVSFIVRQVLLRFVAPKFAHAHILRHSFATICVESGVSLENVAALMGHENISTTMRYLSVSPTRLFEQIAHVF